MTTAIVFSAVMVLLLVIDLFRDASDDKVSWKVWILFGVAGVVVAVWLG